MGKLWIPISFVVAIVIAAIAWNTVGNDYVTKMIGKLVKQEVQIVMSNYEAKQKESEKKITALNAKIKKVEGKINENKPPTDSIELRNRYCKYGVVPVGYECPR